MMVVWVFIDLNISIRPFWLRLGGKSCRSLTRCWPKSTKVNIFRGGDFLSVTARSHPSWGWQSILHGRQLLLQGLRWQIGDGTTTPLLSSNWVPRIHPDGLVYNPRVLPDEAEPKVDAVIIQGAGRWCDESLSQWFPPVICQAIKAIPLPRDTVADKLIWHESRDGLFSLKTAYHLAVRLDKQGGRWRSMASWMDWPSWIRLWNADLPPKLKIFLWQLFHRLLPTTEALIEKKVQVLPRCPVCWAEKETLEHLFLDCPVARSLWEHSGLEDLGEGLPRHTFPLFLKKLMVLIHQPQMVMAVVAVLWRIWRSRNWVVFEGKQYGIPALMRQLNQQYLEWVNLPKDRVMPTLTPRMVGGGTESAPSLLTCMWDGATRGGSHSAGGMVLFDSEGRILHARGVHFPDIDDPMTAELLTLREGLRWCLELGFTEANFQGDARVVIDKVNNRDSCDNQVGAVLEEVIQFLAVHSSLNVRFVGRRSNRVTHLVARKALSLYPTTCRSFDFLAWLNSRI
ncbi:unnamed protein product [Linum trigynum]|uniref:Reverse transcriptase zinc-binding domain-containing protein n=1 Tax=Linum trigynum TaxID=586398 RepID=A0AAV2GPS2_9ROSI